MRLSIIFVAQFIILCFLYDTLYNAREAHRHTHQIGCAVNVQDLCKYVGNKK